MKIVLITIFLSISSLSVAYSDDISNKNIGQGAGAFIGILSGQLLEVNNPYALATGGLLGMFVGGKVGEHYDRVESIHLKEELEVRQCFFENLGRSKDDGTGVANDISSAEVRQNPPTL